MVDALRLHVCNTPYDFSSAAVPGGFDEFTGYQWNVGFNWPAGIERTLRLSLPANNAATGEPAITGTAQAGQELTADASPIMDADGLPSSFTYQWVRVDADGLSNPADITDATAATYTLTAADAGKKIKVQVSFTDELSGEEERTSAAYPSSGTVTAASTPNTAPTAANKTVTTGEDRPYTFMADDFGFDDTDAGDTLASVTIVTPPALGTLALDGTAVLADGVVTKAQIDGDMLTFTPARDAHGDPYTTFTFTVNDGTDDSASAYTMTIDVTDAPAPVCAAPSFGTRRNFWTGTVTVEAFDVFGTVGGYGFDEARSAGTLLPSQSFSIGSNSYSIDEISVGISGDLFFSLDGSDQLTDRENVALRLHVCDGDYDFNTASEFSDRTDITWNATFDWSPPVVTRTVYLSLPANNAATGEPAITGTAQAGQELTADASPIMDADGLPSSFTYKWFRVDSDGTSNEAEISGETAATYTLTAADAGKTIKVQVSFTDELSGEEERTSAAYPSSGTVTAASTTAPVLTSVTVTSTPRKESDTYGAREHIEFSMTFDAPVTVTGAPTFAFDLGGASTATWYAGSGTTTLRFSHAVSGGSSGDEDTNGISWAQNAIALNGGTIAGRDNAVAAVLTHVAQSNLAGHKVDGRTTAVTPATVTVAVTSTPTLMASGSSTADTYGFGETIVITVTVSEAVEVVGDPVFRFSLTNSGGAANDVPATYDRTRSSATTMVFTYTVQAGDRDNNGIWIGDHSRTFMLDANDRIRTASQQIDIDRSHPEKSTHADHKVNGSLGAPTVPPDPTAPTLVLATATTLTIEWTHPGDGGSPLTRNFIEYRVEGTTDWTNWYRGETPTPVTRTVIRNLAAATAYDVRVHSTNAIGNSQWAQSATAFSTLAGTAATGAPTITGTAAVGQPLAVDLTGIEDADGLTNVSYSYQWVRVDTDGLSNPADIADATDATYTLVDADLGTTLKVRVTFDDDGGSTETLTSAATATVTPAAGTPASPTNLSATVGVGQVVLWWQHSTEGGAARSSYEYRSSAGDMISPEAMWQEVRTGTGALNQAYFQVVKGLTSGTTHTFQVRAVNAQGGSAPATVTATPLSQPSCTIDELGDRRRLWQGQLTAGIRAIATDGKIKTGYGQEEGTIETGTLTPAAFTFRSTTYSVITWTSGDLLTVVLVDPDFTVWYPRDEVVDALRWHVCNTPYDFSNAQTTTPEDLFTSFVGYRWNVGSIWPPGIERTLRLSLPPNHPATGDPVISGTVQVGEELTALTDGIMDEDELDDVFTYQWVRVDADGTSNEEDITDATDATYTLTADDRGKKVKVEVRFVDILGGEETRTSAPTATLPGVTVSTPALTVTEEDTAGDSYTVVLNSQPTANVTVTVAGHAGTDVTLTPSSATLTFTPTNWGTAQTVTVTAGDDADTANESVSLTHSAASTDSDYDGITIAGVAVTVTDNDALPGVTVSTPALTVTEEDTAGDSYTVVLNSQPTANVTVTVAGHAGTDVTLTPSSATLTFTPTNWGTAQTVTVTAGDDADTANESVSLTHSAASTDSEYQGITIAGVAVTVTDNDAADPAVCAVPSLSGRNVIWTGAMTVAVDPTFAGVFGFERERFGSLDDQTFTVGANDYTTQQVSLMGNVLTFGTTNSALTAGEQAVLRLHVCAADLDFSAAPVPTGHHAYLFSTPGLSWSSGDAITLRLSLPAGPPPPPPPPVTDLAQVLGVGVVPGNAQLVVTWTAVSTATGYTVQWTSSGQGYNIGDRQATVTTGSTTRHTIPGLTNGTEYTVRVIATRTGADDGPPSDEMTGTPRVPPPPPPPVTDLAQVMGVGVVPGNAQLVVTWTAVDNATGYTVQWMSSGQGYNIGDRQATVTTGSTTRYTIPSLTNGTEYTVRVIATRTGADDGPPSDEMTGTPRVPPPVTDLAQVLGVGVVPGNAQLVVTWTAVDNATGYTVQWMSSGQGYNIGDRQATVTSGSTTRYTIPSLTNGTPYTVRVIATRTGAIDGPPSAEVKGTPFTTPGAPQHLRGEPGDAQVTLTWDAPSSDGGSAILRYEYAIDDSGTWIDAGLDLEETVPGLTNGQQYAFEVRAVNSAGPGAPARTAATPLGMPSVPESLTATGGDGEVVLEWTEPADDGGSPVTGYGYRYAAGQAVPEDVTWRDAGTELTATVTGLENETRYTFEVRARNRVGPGETSGTTALPLRLRAELFSSAAAEGEALVLGVRRSGRLAFPAHAYIGVTDSALPGVTATDEGRDDGLGRHRLEFAAGAAEATVTVTVAFDGERRQDRVLTATLDSAELEVDGVRRPYELVTPTLVVPVTEGDAGLSVADARVQGNSSVLAFTVSMDRTRDVAVRVDYATEDGAARAGEGYTPVSGTLTIEAGGRERTVEVPVLPALHVTGERTLTLRLSNAVSAVIDDGVATGVIVRESELPKAWLARFGRTASDHAAQAIARRLEAGQRETQVTVAGRRVDGLSVDGLLLGVLPSGGWRPASAVEDMATRLAAPALAASRAPFGGVDADPGTPGLRAGTWGGAPGALDREPFADAGQTLRRAVLPDFGFRLPGAHEEALLGTSFYVERGAQQDVGGGTWAAWGDVAATRFEGNAGGLALNGDVVTGTAGLDRQWRAVLVGLALSRSSGEGGYGTGAGTIASTLTSVHPYVQVRLGERAQVWGAAGWGRGGLEITPESGAALEADLRNSMAAAGARAVLMGAGGLEIALRSDFLWTETSSDGTAALAEAVGTASRGRLMLEGAGQIQGLGGVVRPKVEGGVRYDRGDAETGQGFEVGGGLDWARGSLTLQLSGRMLVAHADESYEEWGYSGSLVYEPGTDGMGLQMRVGSSAGAAASGIRNLWALENASGLVRGGAVPFAQRFDAEVGYGLGSGTFWYPYFVADDSGQTRYGLKLSSGRTIGVGLEFGRRESVDLGPEDAMLLRGELRF